GGLCGLARCVGLDPGLNQAVLLVRETQRGEALRRRCRGVAERTAGKQHVVDEVFERRLTLLAAAAAFRRLHEATAEAGLPPEPCADDLSEEGLCRNVLVWVRANLNGDPRREAVLRDLEAQFVDRFHHAPPPEDTPEAGPSAG